MPSSATTPATTRATARTFRFLTIAAFALTGVSGAEAALTPGERCEALKLKSVATYTTCRFKADIASIFSGDAPDYTKCTEKFDTKFSRVEDNAGVGVCPSEGDLDDIRDYTDDFETTISILLSGGTLPTPSCGDGNITVGEDCEEGDLDGQTCASQGFFNGTLRCGPGCDFDTSDCNAARFEDTGATIIDHETDLEWEKKTSMNMTANLGDPHDADNAYTWTATAMGQVMSGTLYTDFLTKLNGTTDPDTEVTSGCFDNHCDWRIPTIDELKTIAILSPGCGGAPCIQDAELAPMRNGGYWSNSTRSGIPSGAHLVNFNTGAVTIDAKTTSYFARAVRSLE